jgi:AraC family transcriptional regulator
MSNIPAIAQAVEYIEDNLTEDTTVAEIAEAVSYSLYHFCRTFNRVVHHSPYDYMMRRRLSESARTLLATDKKIIEVALDYCFNSPEAYSRAFKRLFGIQPTQWRKQGWLDRRRLMSRLTLAHLEHRNRSDYLRPVLEERDAFQVAGIMSLVGGDRTVIPRLWDLLAQACAGLEQVVTPKRYYGITFYPQAWETHSYFYMAAVEVKSLAIASPALVVKTIPPSRYVRFVHKGRFRDLELTLDYVYQTWLPKSGQCLSQPLEIEAYGQDLGVCEDAESEQAIYIPIE